MLDGLRWLRAAGADCVVIPCNTAHAYVEELVASTGVPVLDMVTAALRSCQAVRPGVRRVGVLATRGTRAARLYERAGSRLGIEVVQVPSAVQREHVDTAIRTVKAGGDLAEAARSIETAARVLHALGAEVGVAACTEIPLVMAGAERVLPMVDSTAGLVEAALARLAVRTGP